MNTHNNNMSWFFSIFAFVALFTGGSFLFVNDSSAQAEMIQFSDLSDADVEMILAVKAEMNTTRIQ